MGSLFFSFRVSSFYLRRARDFAMALVNFASVKELPEFQARVSRLDGNAGLISFQGNAFFARSSLAWSSTPFVCAEWQKWKTLLQHIDELDEALDVFIAGHGNDFDMAQVGLFSV